MPALRDLIQQMLDAEEYNAARVIARKYASGRTLAVINRRIDNEQSISEQRSWIGSSIEVANEYKGGL